MNVDLFNETGYIVIEDFLSQEDTKTIKDICSILINSKKNATWNNLKGLYKNNKETTKLNPFNYTRAYPGLSLMFEFGLIFQ